MKNIVRSILFIVVLLLVGDLFMEVSARHDLNPKCYTFQGQGTGVPSAGGLGQPAGILNSGITDFDAYLGFHKYQACGEVNVDGNLDISGWAWNTNLGSISFRCTAGSNFGAPCGAAIDYGSSIFNLAGQDYLMGYAWADNAGWISLGCMDYDGDGLLENYVLGTMDDPRLGNKVGCGGVEYGTEISVDGSLTGYAYSELVGWMSMTGARIDWPVLDTDKGGDLDGDGIKDGTVVEGFPEDPLTPTPEMPAGRFTYNDADGNVRGYAYANGEDYYDVRVQLTEDGVAMTCDQAALRSPLMFLTHNGADINHDQIDGVSPGAVTVTDFTCDGVDTYTARVTSLAPTGTSPNGDITYQTFTLENLNVLMEDFRGVTRSFDVAMNESLTFVPAVYIDSFQSKDANGDWQSLLYASRNSSVPVRFVGGRYRAGGQVPANEEIFIYGTYSPDLSESNPYTFYDDPTGNGPDLDADGNIDSALNRPNFSFDVAYNLLDPDVRGQGAGVNTATPYQRYVYAYSSDPSAPESQSNSASAELRVEYTTVLSGIPVRYLTSQISAGITFNQFAQLRGNLRLDEGAFQEVVSRQISSECEGDNCEKRAQTGLPSGEYNQSQVRSRLQRILIEKFRGRSGPGSVKRVPGGFDIKITESTILTENRSIDSDNILYYKPSDGNSEPFNVVIDSAITDVDIEPTTIVCEGCDFYIDYNVSDGTSGVPPSIKLGLIALEDKRITSSRKGGNVYLYSDVTETALNIYADGSLYSYSDRDQIDDDGIPQFRSADPAQILKNQYTNYGRIRSNNTLGGSTLLPAITGEGERATTQALQYKARMQDLNFLRYAKTVGNDRFRPMDAEGIPMTIEDNLNLGNGPPFYWVSGILLSPSLGEQPQQDPETVINYPLAYGIVNFFDSSSSSLPIFEALSTIAR